ncbi:MAG TPA: sodium-translocating pyrophosphatase, partial [Pseudonocardiaceae bacterium]
MSGSILAQREGLELSGGDYTVVGVVAAVALAALVVGAVLLREVLAADPGTPRMQEIGRAIQEGASAYLNRQFKTLAPFAVIVFLVLFTLPANGLSERIGRSIFFFVGALFSASIGYMGMWLATRANIRVAAASNESGGRELAMRIAFRTGGVVGMITVGLGLFGASLVVMVYAGQAPRVLEGFGFGAALLAMFMRVGGGIFTKAADVGGDLVGKIEAGIPEDDPRNAATIADNVGDNVGDCAGMAADLFESYAVTLVAALILGTAAFGLKGLLFPLIVPAIGVVTAVIGVYITRARAGEPGLVAINRSFYISAAISAVACTVAAFLYLPSSFSALGLTDIDGKAIDQVVGSPAVIAAVAVIIGIVLAGVILWLTGYFTGTEHRPVRNVGTSSLTGAATVILSGISIGLESAVYTAVVIGSAVYAAFLLSGSVTVSLFAIALAGTGLLTTVGVIVAMDTFGPVSDNAQGIAEMSGDVKGAGVGILTELDAVGNTTKAITKGIAIATAVLAATALFGSFRDAIRSTAASINLDAAFNVSVPNVLVGLSIGAAVVFMFSGLAINAVSRAAGAVVYEVRKQFRDNPG